MTPNPAHPILVGDIVTRTGTDRLRVIDLYEGADEIVVQTIQEKEAIFPGDIFDICWFDVELIERAS